MRRWNDAHPGYAAESVRRRRERDGDAVREQDRQEYHRNKYQHAMRVRLRQAIVNGEIERKPCEICGDPDTDAHHDDYSKPFDVRWLCRPHHGTLHRQINDRVAA